MKRTGKKFIKDLSYIYLIGVIALGLITIIGSNGGEDTASNGSGDSSDPVGAPTVTTSDATSLAASTATLNGSVNPNGSSTTYYFEYGTTTDYGSTTISTDAGTGTTSVSVSADLTGLSEGTTYHFRLVATNSVGTSNGDDKILTALTQISIFNQSPTHKSDFTTNSTPVTISGMVNGSISAITWKNVTTGKSGDGTGTESWSVEVPLQEGDNEITITATAISGVDDVTLTLTVTYNSSVEFTSLPQLTPDTGIAGQTYNEIYIRVGIDATDLDASSVKVFKLDNSENKLGDALGSLTDDGNLNNGDEIEGDGIYSTKISLTSSEAGPINIKVFASDTDGTQAKTSALSFIFFSQITDDQIDQQSANNNLAVSKFNELVSANMRTLKISKKEATTRSLDDMVTYLKGLVGVLDSGKGGLGVWWLSDTGMIYVMSSTFSGDEQILSEAFGKRSSLIDSTLKRARPSPDRYDIRSTRVEYLKTGAGPKRSAALADKANDGNNYVGSSNAIHLSPYVNVSEWYEEHTDTDGTGWFDVVDVSTCPVFNKASMINLFWDTQNPDAVEVPLDIWKSLSDYGLISSNTHGETYDIDKGELDEKDTEISWAEWLWPWHNKRVVIYTNYAVPHTKEGLADYQEDLKAGRLMLFPKGQDAMLVITPEFIDFYNKEFPNSIWFNMSCRSAFNDTMAAVFLAKGGGAYYGFSDYLWTQYAYNTERTVLQKIINEGKNTGEAFDAAVAAHGADMGFSASDNCNPAALVLYGNNELKVSVSELKNPSFEKPELNGWATEGDGRAIKVLGSDSPTEGDTMAIISTGLGFTEETGSISQTLCLPANAKNLLFDWNFYSEEFKEWCDSSFDDTFEVSIVDIETGTETVLFDTSVNTLCGDCQGSESSEACQALSLLVSPVNFDQDDYDVWYTGWQSGETVDISTYKGKGVILKFLATDKGDSSWDTAVLIDNIRITTD